MALLEEKNCCCSNNNEKSSRIYNNVYCNTNSYSNNSYSSSNNNKNDKNSSSNSGSIGDCFHHFPRLSNPVERVSHPYHGRPRVQQPVLQDVEGCDEGRVGAGGQDQGGLHPRQRDHGRSEEIHSAAHGVNDGEGDEAVAIEALHVAAGVLVGGVVDQDTLDK